MIRDLKIKHFLRGDEIVEVFVDSSWYWRSGHWQETRRESLVTASGRSEAAYGDRSVMRALLSAHMSEEEIDSLTDGDGHWYLPGSPP